MIAQAAPASFTDADHDRRIGIPAPDDPSRPFLVPRSSGQPTWHDTIVITFADTVAADVDHDGRLGFVGSTPLLFRLFGPARVRLQVDHANGRVMLQSGPNRLSPTVVLCAGPRPVHRPLRSARAGRASGIRAPACC
jgi:hypothetical protein